MYASTNTQSCKYRAPTIPGQLLIDMFVTKQEEKLMSITEAATDNWRKENNMPASEGLLEIINLNLEEQQKRARSGTVGSSTSRAAGKKRRKH
ncbi:hypothetical protein BJ912DRAFT_1003998 [Pholiota molesta]|nr:hypothetical protein BJ912DRAFT_1003998 [Pholiota molesta]